MGQPGGTSGRQRKRDGRSRVRPPRVLDDPTYGPKRHSQEVFAKQLAAVLKARGTGFARLLVVAAPKFLGDLRQQLDESVRKKVAAEFAKDLTQLSAHELAPHLDKLVETMTTA